MKKQVLNKETKAVLMEIELMSDSPEVWARALSAYSWDCEIELYDVTDTIEENASFWSKTKSWLSSFFTKSEE